MRTLAWLLALYLTGARALHNFSHPPRLFDIDALGIFAEVEYDKPNGRLWSYVTLPGINLTAAEIKAGVGKVGPGSCHRLGEAISNEEQFFGLTSCGFTPGATYTFRVYVEELGSGEEGLIFREDFTVAPDPWPLPVGPYCFDRDADYFGSTIEGVVAGVADAETCQAICQASPTCLHFRYVYSSALPDYQNCSRISAVRTIVGASPNVGIMVGPRSCETRSVNYFRPHAVITYTDPTPAIRTVPFSLLVKGVNFEPTYDRVLLVPLDQPCNLLNPDGSYHVSGLQPGSVAGWARLPCNGTPSVRPDVSMLVCGRPPETVVFSEVGDVKLCICDAGRTPYGCDYQGGSIADFFERALQPRFSVQGPYPNQTRYCPASRLCRVEDLQGHKLGEGDKLMIRASCSPLGRDSVVAYTGASNPAPLAYGLLFPWTEPNTVVCSANYTIGPCATGRICYCPREHGCTDDSHFLADAGEMIFFRQPSAPDGLAILQEDYESFTFFWKYPAHDGGGGVVDHYTIYFKTCARGGIEDGSLATIVIPSEPGDNQFGKASNGTFQFRRVPYGYYSSDILPATRYCIQISATNAAGEGQSSPEFVWLTDVHPPTDLHYKDPPLFLVRGIPMASMLPTVTTQDCRTIPSVVSMDRHVRAEECDVQLYEVSPPLPRGLSLDNATGNISGTPLDVSPRPQIYMVTATNAGGKSSVYISLGVVERLEADPAEPSLGPTIAMCLNSFGVNDAVITFRTPPVESARWREGCAGHPQNLRLTVLDTARALLFQSSGEGLDGHVAREEAVPCGQFVLDTWSSSRKGFPPPGLCFWESGSGGGQAWAEIIFQGSHGFEANTWYQLAVKMRVAQLTPVGSDILQLDLLCAEASTEEDSVDSRHLGVWTPTLSLPRWRAELSLEPPTPLATPVADAPWVNGQPFYVPGFGNPLAGEAPKGEPLPWGFPAPGPTTCYNATSRCPTSPHHFTNTPGDTTWYRDVDFPSFRVLTGVATLLTHVLTAMRFNPLAFFNVTALPRPEVAAGNQQPLRISQQEFMVDFTLSLDARGRIKLERDLTLCPSSPLQWPFLWQQPTCRISSGPIYVQCSCESTLPAAHPAARCDRVLLKVSDQLEVRSQVTATLRIYSGSEPSFVGFLPIRWYGQVKSSYGGLESFHKTENAGLDVWPDLVLQQTTPEACAEECLQRVPGSGAGVPCRSFKFHRPDSDCYLSQHVETDFIAIRRDWPGNPYDNYEYQEQVVFTNMTPGLLFTMGLFFTDVSIKADTFLDPPLPSPPPFGVSHFFPSYVGQPHLVFSVSFVPVAPVYGQDPWRSKVFFQPPAGFRPVSLRALPGSVPTAQGLGYCGGAGAFPSCSWFLSWGQTLWPPSRYRFELIVHNPEDPGLAGQLWYIVVQSAGFSTTGSIPSAVPVAVPHPLPVEGRLEGCSAHFAAVRPVLPSGRLAEAAAEAVDLFFVLPSPWQSGTVLKVVLPRNFTLPETCRASSLTPWIPHEHLRCSIDRDGEANVRFDGPLRAQAAVALRLVPFSLPADYAAVHPGKNFWPLASQDAVQPKSLNVRLQVLQAPKDPGGTPSASDACHPSVWSCGLEGGAWAARRLELRPSKEAFATLEVRAGHPEPFRFRRSWAYIEFAVSASLVFEGALDDVLFVSPPYGFAVTGLYSADVQVLSRAPSSGQLNLPLVLQLTDALHAAPGDYILGRGGGDAYEETRGQEPEGGSVLRVRRLHGAFMPGEVHHLNLSFQFPASGAEPSLAAADAREPGRSGCAHAWGLALESGGERLAAGYVPAEPLAFVAQFEASCAAPAAGADNLLTFRFVTTQRALPSSLPPGSVPLLLFTLPGHFELADPAVAADFAAPFRYNRSRGAPIFGAAEPEAPAFQKLGCPRLFFRSRGRLLRAPISECAVHFNDAQDVLEVALVVDRLAAATAHQLLLRVRNPIASTGLELNASALFGLSVFRMSPGQAFAQVPAPLESEGSRSLLRVQSPLQVAACGPLLPAMQAAVETSLCTLEGRSSEITMSFIAPIFMPRPVSAIVTAPAGYRIPWTCNTSVSFLSLPAVKRFDPILESMLTDCVVAPDGRTANFMIRKDLKAFYVWHYFTFHVINPHAEDAPATPEQHVFSLVVGGYAAGSADALAMPAPALRVLTDLELRELPFTYNDTSWALALRLRTSVLVPAGGYVLLRAPGPFVLPVEQCRGGNATGYAEAPGSPLFIPALDPSPFLPLPEPDSAGQEPAAAGRLPGLPQAATCLVPGSGQLAVALLDGYLPSGLYELRFAAVADQAAAPLLAREDAQEGPLAPLRWTVETWRPAISRSCAGACCAERRPNFRPIVGVPELELAERGVLEAYPSGAFRHRRVVFDSYGGWRYSNDPA